MITVVGCVDDRTTPMGIVKKYYDDPDNIAMAGQTFSFCSTLSSKERFNRFRIGLRQYQVRHIQIVGWFISSTWQVLNYQRQAINTADNLLSKSYTLKCKPFATCLNCLQCKPFRMISTGSQIASVVNFSCFLPCVGCRLFMGVMHLYVNNVHSYYLLCSPCKMFVTLSILEDNNFGLGLGLDLGLDLGLGLEKKKYWSWSKGLVSSFPFKTSNWWTVV